MKDLLKALGASKTIKVTAEVLANDVLDADKTVAKIIVSARNQFTPKVKNRLFTGATLYVAGKLIDSEIVTNVGTAITAVTAVSFVNKTLKESSVMTDENLSESIKGLENSRVEKSKDYESAIEALDKILDF